MSKLKRQEARETSKAKKSQKIKQRDGTELAWVIIRTLTAHTAMAIGVNVTLKLNKKLKRQEEREMLKVRKSRQPRKIGTQAKKSQKIKQRDGTVMAMVDTIVHTDTDTGANVMSKLKRQEARETSKAKKSQKIKQRDGTELAWVIIRTLTAHTAMAIGVNVT